jgi:hypothetical protein
MKDALAAYATVGEVCNAALAENSSGLVGAGVRGVRVLTAGARVGPLARLSIAAAC